MDILKVDPDYDCADTDNRFENLPKDEQAFFNDLYDKAQEKKTSEGSKTKKPDQQEETK
jgi:hypothetical protein